MVVKAYAKLNLVLNVTRNKKEGYPEIESLMIPISLHDSIDISLLKEGNNTYVTCEITVVAVTAVGRVIVRVEFDFGNVNVLFDQRDVLQVRQTLQFDEHCLNERVVLCVGECVAKVDVIVWCYHYINSRPMQT